MCACKAWRAAVCSPVGMSSEILRAAALTLHSLAQQTQWLGESATQAKREASDIAQALFALAALTDASE